jgi:hypothetical protein
MDIPSIKTWPFNEAILSWRTPNWMKSSSTWGQHSLNSILFAKHSQGDVNVFTHMRGQMRGHYLHFTLLPKHDKVKEDTGLSEGLHITICFNIGSKNISKGDAWSECLNCLHKMNILLGTDYSSPIDVALNQITKNRTSYITLIYNWCGPH